MRAGVRGGVLHFFCKGRILPLGMTLVGRGALFFTVFCPPMFGGVLCFTAFCPPHVRRGSVPLLCPHLLVAGGRAENRQM